MSKFIRGTKRTTEEHYNEQGYLQGKSIVTEEYDLDFVDDGAELSDECDGSCATCTCEDCEDGADSADDDSVYPAIDLKEAIKRAAKELNQSISDKTWAAEEKKMPVEKLYTQIKSQEEYERLKVILKGLGFSIYES